MPNHKAERQSRTPLDPRAAFAEALRRGGSMSAAQIEGLLSEIGPVLAGTAEGRRPVVRVARAAVAQLPAKSLAQARGILLDVAVGDGLTEAEFNEAAEAIHGACPAGEILLQIVREERMAGTVRVTVITVAGSAQVRRTSLGYPEGTPEPSILRGDAGTEAATPMSAATMLWPRTSRASS